MNDIARMIEGVQYSDDNDPISHEFLKRSDVHFGGTSYPFWILDSGVVKCTHFQLGIVRTCGDVRMLLKSLGHA